MKKNLKKKRKILYIAKDCEVEVSLQEDGFKGSWFRAILEQNPTRVTGKKLRVCYKTLFNEDGVNPCKETIERCFIRPVPPECVNEGVIFKEGSVVDAYFNNDIMRFIRSQLRPHADWIGSEWIKSKNKLLSQHMFRTGKLVEMTREISESEKDKIWVRALVITEIQGGDRRNFLIKRDCEVEVSLQEDGFRGSWFRAILEQNPTRVKGKKLRVCYKTLFNEDGVNPCKETIERCFIRPVPPEYLNEGVVFKEGSVVDAYFNNGWWTGLIVVERPEGSFLVYFDDPPDIMRFIRSQLRPHVDWIGSEWVKSKNKVLSQHMFRKWKLVEMTLEIKYSLNDYVEVVVRHGWRKGRVTEILLENNYKVYFAATKEDAIFNYTEIRLSIEWLGGGSWIKAHEREFENNAATPIRPAQESPSNTLVLESNEDDTVNDDATEIKSSRESHSNTSFLEATETETQNHEPVDGVELPLPHESDDMMDDVATPIIDPQEIPRGKM
ncbi:hypothetical protein DY000_02062465 [Brassica cretica]|uniref:Agenet domain-containing protein n=2 Tax=Brassica TaxID=3705 RepID=A0ABQ7ARY4_BRACR|nr:hypothetical protein DY000_02062465 [Brassica cretica]